MPSIFMGFLLRQFLATLKAQYFFPVVSNRQKFYEGLWYPPKTLEIQSLSDAFFRGYIETFKAICGNFKLEWNKSTPIFLWQKYLTRVLEANWANKVKFWFLCGWELVTFIFLSIQVLCNVLFRTKWSQDSSTGNKNSSPPMKWSDILQHVLVK